MSANTGRRVGLLVGTLVLQSSRRATRRILPQHLRPIIVGLRRAEGAAKHTGPLEALRHLADAARRFDDLVDQLEKELGPVVEADQSPAAEPRSPP